MSRASDLRDAVRDELATRLERTVDAVLVPAYSREELASFDGPRVWVRRGRRRVSAEQGPDTRLVVIEVGLAGLLPEKAEGGETKAGYLAQRLAAADSFDDLLERTLSFWTPCGPLSECYLAEHSFVSIDEVQVFDAKEMDKTGIYIPVLQITYFDSLDDLED